MLLKSLNEFGHLKTGQGLGSRIKIRERLIVTFKYYDLNSLTFKLNS